MNFHSCESRNIYLMRNTHTYLDVIDYSVSGEKFKLLCNEDLEMLETFPRPPLDKLPEYYKSEDYISHTDFKRNLFEHIYHFIRKISLGRKLRLINSLVSMDRNLLDIGCGTGDFLRTASANGWNIKGIEPDEKARQIANIKTKSKVFGTEELKKTKANSFDVITLWHVFEHLPNPEDQLSFFRTLLRDEGFLIIAIPNFKSYDANYYKNYWAAYDVPRHLWHFSRRAITGIAERNQMKIVEVLPMPFDAFYVSLLSEKYKRGTINPIRAFWVGLSSNLKARKNGEYSSLIYVLKKRIN